MDIEGMREASYEEQKKKGLMAEGFHLDPKKEAPEPVEKLFEKLGPIGAFDELTDKLPKDTDKEVVRQMKFILNKVLKQNQH